MSDYFKWKELNKMEDKPFTPSQVKDECKRETNNWTDEKGVFRYGFEEEALLAQKYLKKHGYNVEYNIEPDNLFPNEESYNVWFSKGEIPDFFETGEWLKEGKKKKKHTLAILPNPKGSIDFFNHVMGADKGEETECTGECEATNLGENLHVVEQLLVSLDSSEEFFDLMDACDKYNIEYETFEKPDEDPSSDGYLITLYGNDDFFDVFPKMLKELNIKVEKFKTPDGKPLNEIWTNGSGPGYYETIDYIKRDLEDAEVEYWTNSWDGKTYICVPNEFGQAADEIICAWVGENYERNIGKGDSGDEEYEFVIEDKYLYNESLEESYNILDTIVKDGYKWYCQVLANRGESRLPTDGELADFLLDHSEEWVGFPEVDVSDPFKFNNWCKKVASICDKLGLKYELEESLNEDLLEERKLSKSQLNDFKNWIIEQAEKDNKTFTDIEDILNFIFDKHYDGEWWPMPQWFINFMEDDGKPEAVEQYYREWLPSIIGDLIKKPENESLNEDIEKNSPEDIAITLKEMFVDYIKEFNSRIHVKELDARATVEMNDYYPVAWMDYGTYRKNYTDREAKEALEIFKKHANIVTIYLDVIKALYPDIKYTIDKTMLSSAKIGKEVYITGLPKANSSQNFKYHGLSMDGELKEEFEESLNESLEEDMKPWIMQQGENGEPEFIGWAKSQNDMLDKLVKNHASDSIGENTYIHELEKYAYEYIKKDLSDDEIKELDNYFKECLKEELKEIKVADNTNIEKDAEECPLPLEVIPNEMGINLSNVEKVKWEEQEDGQLKKVEIDFNPGDDLEEDIEKHDELNPKLFDGEELKPEIKEAIQKIVNEFVSELNADGIALGVKDIILLGSNVSYNYTKDSDLDVHIIADPNSLDCSPEIQDKLYGAYRSIFNKNYPITIKEIPVELYVEMDKTNANSNGMYSLNNGWIKKPEQTVIPDLDEEAFEQLFNEWEDKYFALIGEHSNEPIKEDYHQQFDEPSEEDIEDCKKFIWDSLTSHTSYKNQYADWNLNSFWIRGNLAGYDDCPVRDDLQGHATLLIAALRLAKEHEEVTVWRCAQGWDGDPDIFILYTKYPVTKAFDMIKQSAEDNDEDWGFRGTKINPDEYLD